MNAENMTNMEATTEATQANGGQKTFTQDDVNRIVQDRLAKDRAKASEEMGKRERELAEREFRLNSRQKLIDRGYPESVMEALNCSSEDAFNKALDIIDGLMKERAEVKRQETLEANKARFTQPAKPHRGAGADLIRRAMNL